MTTAVDFEALSGATFQEIAQVYHLAYRSVLEGAPSWEDLSEEERVSIEVGIRQVQNLFNGQIRTDLREFAQTRLNARSRVEALIANKPVDRLR